MVPLALALRRQRSLPNARLWFGLLIAAFFGVVLNQILFTEGMARTIPEHSAVVNAAIPTWTLLAAVIARQERLGVARVLAIGCALLGVLYLLGADRLLLSGDAPMFDQGATVLGDVLTMMNGMSFAIHLVIMRRIGRDLDPWLATAVLFASSLVMIGAWSGPHVHADDARALLTPPIVWFALYAVLFSTVLTYFLNTWALRHAHSSQVALYINVQPLVATILNSAMGAPLPGHRFFVALVLVALGLWLQSRASRLG
jgi:drug/metabolite transporter (DMT)-like permease